MDKLNLTSQQVTEIFAIDDMVTKMARYFRSIELNDGETLFSTKQKIDRVNKLHIHYVITRDNKKVLESSDFEEQMHVSNVLFEDKKDTAYTIILKKKVVISVNTETNYISVRPYMVNTVYGDRALYVASRRVNARLFISELLSSFNNKSAKTEEREEQ